MGKRETGRSVWTRSHLLYWHKQQVSKEPRFGNGIISGARLFCGVLCYLVFSVSSQALLILLKLLHLHSADLQWKSEQSDEAVGVVMVVEFASREGSQGLAV